MDMTLAEQLVWAAVYARSLSELREIRDMDERALHCIKAATAAVLHLRDMVKYANNTDGVQKLLGHEALMHLRQMTFKAED